MYLCDDIIQKVLHFLSLNDLITIGNKFNKQWNKNTLSKHVWSYINIDSQKEYYHDSSEVLYKNIFINYGHLMQNIVLYKSTDTAILYALLKKENMLKTITVEIFDHNSANTQIYFLEKMYNEGLLNKVKNISLILEEYNRYNDFSDHRYSYLYDFFSDMKDHKIAKLITTIEFKMKNYNMVDAYTYIFEDMGKYCENIKNVSICVRKNTYVDHYPINEDAINYLCNIETIEYLTVRSCNFKDEWIKQIKETMPNLVVFEHIKNESLFY